MIANVTNLSKEFKLDELSFEALVPTITFVRDTTKTPFEDFHTLCREMERFFTNVGELAIVPGFIPGLYWRFCIVSTTNGSGSPVG